MLTLLFGVHRNPQRVLCSVLAIILTLLGVLIAVLQDWRVGIPFIVLGLVAVAVLSRHFTARDERVETKKQLDMISGDASPAALKLMVDQSPHDPNGQLGRVTGQFDRAEIAATVSQVRGEGGAGPGLAS